MKTPVTTKVYLDDDRNEEDDYVVQQSNETKVEMFDQNVLERLESLASIGDNTKSFENTMGDSERAPSAKRF